MFKLISLTLLTSLLIIAPWSVNEAEATCNCSNDLVVFGTYETASLVNIESLPVATLIDTGATTTALDARNIKMYINRQGKRWVYYDFHHKPSGKMVSMHQPVSRVARIITHSGSPKERAVVRNTISIGKTKRFLEVSLIDRSNFPQQLLIGRNFLNRTALVNSGKSYLQSKEP
ncbi:hypothetical protein GZ77_07375 [Endozoicomonas montiporae]|uniref:Retropepsin-like aspartic endopeptidase domain-containing protein n=2 Tax=Endozoicomonas montiporae TaxID=1027273 RepID=A0A081N711_9GAMM|nr:RimK/LysX family protein [Endozoicomonas montiporae]AMO55954.1 hypothetical protein EZMO1_1811 [Endozoicomonas montiporae CL-33]KEQ14234.1 hypothetical protein GZ77_07375 [Endozoicomonas montiporae]